LLRIADQPVVADLRGPLARPTESRNNNIGNLLLPAGHKGANDSCVAATAKHECVPRGLYSSGTGPDGNLTDLPRVLYAERFGAATDDWGVRINLAIQASFAAAHGGATTIVLPVGTINISVPIKLWRVRKSTHADTSADAVEHFAALGEVWSAVKGGDTIIQ
jgi:hypothetical protein